MDIGRELDQPGDRVDLPLDARLTEHANHPSHQEALRAPPEQSAVSILEAAGPTKEPSSDRALERMRPSDWLRAMRSDDRCPHLLHLIQVLGRCFGLGNSQFEFAPASSKVTVYSRPRPLPFVFTFFFVITNLLSCRPACAECASCRRYR
jgi:hypothetical protein